MNQRIANKTTGLVDYKELETNILSSIWEGRPLTGRDGALTPFIKNAGGKFGRWNRKSLISWKWRE